MAEIDPSTIATNATKPKRFRGDQGEAEQFSIADQILADEHNKKDDLLDSIQDQGKLPILRTKVRATWP